MVVGALGRHEARKPASSLSTLECAVVEALQWGDKQGKGKPWSFRVRTGEGAGVLSIASVGPR